MSDEKALARVSTEISTQAKPSGNILTRVRDFITKSSGAQNIFLDAKEDKASADQLYLNLAPFLVREMPLEDEGDLLEAVRYLADEYTQVIGENAILLTSPTGETIAKLREEDFYTPPPVARALDPDGFRTRLVPQGPKVRPEILAALIEGQSNVAREKDALQRISESIVQTQALREDGDPRLALTTKAGRKQVFDQFSSSMGELIPGACSGTAARFLRLFEIKDQVPEETELVCLGTHTVRAESSMKIPDIMSRNLKFHALSYLKARVAWDWVRNLGLILSQQYRSPPMALHVGQLKSRDLQGVVCMVGAEDLRPTLRDKCDFLGVSRQDSIALGLGLKAGALIIDPESYASSWEEVFDRWEIYAEMSVTLWVNPTRVRTYAFDGVEPSGVSLS